MPFPIYPERTPPRSRKALAVRSMMLGLDFSLIQSFPNLLSRVREDVHLSTHLPVKREGNVEALLEHSHTQRGMRARPPLTEQRQLHAAIGASIFMMHEAVQRANSPSTMEGALYILSGSNGLTHISAAHRAGE